MTDKEYDFRIEKMAAETAKLQAETSQINQHMKYQFWVVAAGYLGALVLIFKLL